MDEFEGLNTKDILNMAEEFLGPPAIFEFEDSEAFDDKFYRTIETWKPTSMVELILVRDIAYLTWTITRAEALRHEIITKLVIPELEQIYGEAAPSKVNEAATFATGYFNSKPERQTELRKQLYSAITYPKSALASHFRLLGSKIEDLDSITSANEQRLGRAIEWLRKHRKWDFVPTNPSNRTQNQRPENRAEDPMQSQP